jgi:hypothetical protein
VIWQSILLTETLLIEFLKATTAVCLLLVSPEGQTHLRNAREDRAKFATDAKAITGGIVGWVKGIGHLVK